MTFLLLSDLKAAVDFQSACLDLLGDIRIKSEDLVVLLSAHDINTEDEDLAGSCGVTSKDDVIIVEDDVRASDEERCARAVDDDEVL